MKRISRTPHHPIISCDGSGWVDRFGDGMRSRRCPGCKACKKVKLKPSKTRKIDPKKVAEALGAEEVHKVLPHIKSFVDPNVTAEELRKAVGTGTDYWIRREERLKERNKAPEAKKGACVVCNGTVTGEYRSECTTDFRNVPIGPGSRDYFHWVFQGYHCTKCGLKYEFCPLELSTGEQ